MAMHHVIDLVVARDMCGRLGGVLTMLLTAGAAITATSGLALPN